MPGPVRSACFIAGLPANSQSQQREADRGTAMATRTLHLMGVLRRAACARGVPAVATGENPAIPDESHLPSVHFLPEFQQAALLPDFSFAEFPLC
eukprot:10570893-Heterocapsa_arctica.AAC.1